MNHWLNCCCLPKAFKRSLKESTSWSALLVIHYIISPHIVFTFMCSSSVLLVAFLNNCHFFHEFAWMRNITTISGTTMWEITQLKIAFRVFIINPGDWGATPLFIYSVIFCHFKDLHKHWLCLPQQKHLFKY